jgi:hypothetical protein
MAVIDLKDTTIEVQDGGANFIQVKIGEGNVVYTERREMEYIRDRGLLDTVREGDEQPIEVRIDFQWNHLSGNGADNIEDALKKEGSASDWESTSEDECEPYCVDIVIVWEPECVGGEEGVTLPDYRWETLEHDLSAGQLSSTGQCNATRGVTGGALVGT